jgi:hypothetical protein
MRSLIFLALLVLALFVLSSCHKDKDCCGRCVECELYETFEFPPARLHTDECSFQEEVFRLTGADMPPMTDSGSYATGLIINAKKTSVICYYK